MLSPSALSRSFLAVLVASATVVIASCGGADDGLGKRFPVFGKVTYNGNPLESGAISFVPEDNKSGGAAGASGTIENGSYTLSTGGNNDGARAGKYKVTITAKEDATARAKADFQKARSANAKAAGTEEPGYIPKQFVAKAEAQAKSLIPTGYGDVNTTTLTAEVKEQSNSIDFTLSDAQAPPEPKAAARSRGRR